MTGCQKPSRSTPTPATPRRHARVYQLLEHGRLALQVARLTVELNRQLDQLDRSRARIAEAADEERRRIQRDLHDGAQQGFGRGRWWPATLWTTPSRRRSPLLR